MNKLISVSLRSFVAVLLLCATATTVHAQQSEPKLVVWLNDGTSSEVNLLAKPVVTLDGDEIVISSSEVSLRYAVSDIVRFTYNEEAQTYTDIESMRADGGCLFDGDCLVFHDFQTSGHVALYTLGGTQVPADVTRNGNNAVLSLSSIPSGVYLLHVNGKTIKIIKP